ncbi:hydrolase [Streptomyces sp. LP05-1]|uniref:Hydrolase n=1 Tax=Streptomyces pyxinae TaxID=2970734 RepID=A0ABT2CBY6_9ACTN|nr:HAD family acid phosphatase [Streptomyces sp. LP05-1]MCS0634923.1 hydrolase [Streptomyces sp. LP05-1]
MHAHTRTTRFGAALATATAAVTLISATPATAAPATSPAVPGSVSAHPAGAVPAATDGVDYGVWQRDVAVAVAAARSYLEERTSARPGERRAIVLDIDNTSLETDFHHFWEFPTPAVRPVLELARYAKSRGTDVFFVTARPGILHAPTVLNLRAVGFPVAGVYVRDLPDLFEEVSAYKTASRADIEAKGYTVIANIGNRPTDLVGGHAERTFKLPDYDGALS